jgi:uncharacterized FlaG/YvyC family protein
MAAEIEAVRAVAASDPGTGNAFRAPDPGLKAESSALRVKPADLPSGGSSPDVGLVFEVDQASHDWIIKIVDRDTHKVIREIPPEEIQSMRAAMQSILGTILDRTG